MIVEPSEEMTQDPTKPVTPAGFELILAQQANDAISRGANPKATTDRLGTMIRHLRANPDLATHGATALARGADPGAVTSRVWEMAQKGGDPQLHRDIGDLRNQVESTRVSPRSTPQGPDASSPSFTGRDVGGLQRAAEQGASLGWGDEIDASVNAGFKKIDSLLPWNKAVNYGDEREKLLQEDRNRLAEVRSRHPVASTLAEIAGGILPAVAGGGSSLTSEAPLLSRIAAGARQGAAYGGIAGAGASEGTTPKDVAKDAGRGLLAGGVTGAALPAAAAAIKGTGRAIMDISGLRSSSAPERASQKILEALKRDNTDINAIRAALADAGDKPVSIADLAGENTVGLARAAQAIPSDAKQAIKAGLTARQEGQFGRVAGDLENAVGQSRQNVYDTAEQLLEQKKATAEPLYAAAKPKAVSEKLAQEVQRLRGAFPEIDKAFSTGDLLRQGDEALAGGTVAPKISQRILDDPKMMDLLRKSGQIPPESPMTVADVHYAKLGLDDLINSKAEGGGVAPTRARQLRKALGGLLDQMEQDVPEYGKARSTYAGDSAMEEALARGRDFLKEDARVTEKELSRMTPGEQELYKTGALDAVRRHMDQGGDFVRDYLKKPERQQQLRVLLNDDAKFNALDKAIRTEAGMSATNSGVLGNSVTARAQSEIADLQNSPAEKFTADLVRGNSVKGAIAKRAAEAINRRGRGIVGNVADELSGKLTAGAVPGTSLNTILNELAQGRPLSTGQRIANTAGPLFRRSLSQLAGGGATR